MEREGIPVLSNQLLHKAVQDIKKIIGLDLAVWDMEGICQVMTSERMLVFENAVREFQTVADMLYEKIETNAGYFTILDDEEPAYVLVIEGNTPELSVYGRMGASQLSNLLFAYKEKMDRNRFFQNLLLNNILLVDVYNQARKMNISIEQRRCVFVIES